MDSYYNPSPEQIASITAAIRSGELVVSRTSEEHWRKVREAEAFTGMVDRYDAATDECPPMPSFLKGEISHI